MGNPTANTEEARSCLSRKMPLLHTAINQTDELRSGFCQTNHHVVMNNLGRAIQKQSLRVMSTDITFNEQQIFDAILQKNH